MSSLDTQLSAIEATVRALDPHVKAAKRKPFAGAPAELSALWAWGFAAAAFERPELAYDGGLEWLSPSEAHAALKALRAEAVFPTSLFPFITDGAGNYLCMEAGGRVLEWDHETRKTRVLAKSLAGFLAPRLKMLKAAATLKAKAKAHVATPARSVGSPVKGLKRVPSPFLNKYDAKGYGGGVQGAAMSTDGTRFIMRFRTSRIAFDREKEVPLENRFTRCDVVAAHPTESRFLVVSSTDVTIFGSDGKASRSWPLDAGVAVGCGFLAEQRFFVVTEQALFLYSTTAAKPLAAYPAKDLIYAGVDTRGAPFALATADAHSACVLHRLTAKGLVSKRFADIAGRSLAISATGEIAIGTRTGTIVVADAKGEQVRTIKAHTACVTSLHFVGERLLSTGDTSVSLWDPANGKRLASVPAKSRNHAPTLKLAMVTQAHALTVEPLALFELR